MSDDIPDPVKRQLRQEAGFGCCFCGLPVLQYHHIIPRHVEMHNRREDMMAVCPLCHDKITKGAVPEYDQRQAKAQPHNILAGLVEGTLTINHGVCAIAMGTVELVNDGFLLRADGQPLLQLEVEDERLLLTLALYDEHDELLLLVNRNEWVAGDPLAWDIEADYQRLTLRAKARDVRLKLDTRGMPVQLQAKFWRAGISIELARKGLFIDADYTEPAQIRDLCLVATVFDIDTAKRTVEFGPDERYGSYTFCGAESPIQRIIRGINRLRVMQGKIPEDFENTYGSATEGTSSRP